MSKKRNLIFICLLILGVFLITSCLPKPPVTEGILKGQVIVPEGTLQEKDLTGQALPDATVNIIDPATGDIIATTTTDVNGYYQVFVPAGGPYLLQVVKDGVVILQITPQVEVGIEYDLGTADCSTTAVALIALAMMDAGANLADINLDDIAADPNFDDVLSNVTSIIEAGGDPTESAVIQQAVEDFLSPPAPPPPPTPTYTVTYDGNGSTGGTVPTDANNYEQGDSVTVLGNTGNLVKTQDGISLLFTGWNTAANGSETSYNEADTFNMGNANVTLFAQWSVLRGTGPAGGLIFYDKGDVSDGWRYLEAAPSDQSAGPSQAWSNIIDVEIGISAQGIAIGTGQTNTTAIIEQTGHTESAAKLCNELTIGSYNDWFLPSEDELNLMYTNLYSEGVGGFYNDSYWSSSEVNAAVARFQYFWPGSTPGNYLKSNSAVRVRAARAFRSTAPTYMVNYNGNGFTDGTVPSDSYHYEQGETVTVLGNTGTLVKTGYTFAGWNTQADGGGTDRAAGSTFVLGASNVILYAKWTINTYTVSFDKNGGDTEADPTTKPATHGGNVGTLPTAPTRTGYTFTNWNTEANGSGTEFTASTAVTADITVYAQWTINTYTVTYNGNTNSGGTAPIDSSSPYEYGEEVTVLNKGDLVKADYTFTGWNTAADGGGTDRAAGSTFVLGASNVTLYAQWTINTYTVTFDSQGGTVVTSQIVDHGGKATEPTAPTKTGHTFGGWYKELACTNVWDFTTDTVIADVTLYAKWTINSYTVTYNGNGNTGGTVPAGPISYTYGTTVTVLGNTGALVKTGYIFSDWNTWSNGNGTDRAAGSTFVLGASNVILYAKWTTYSLRDEGPAGGLIFYINPNYLTDGWRYLEAAPASTEWSGIQWGSWGALIGGTETGIGTGESNTNIIVTWLNNHFEYNRAAEYCFDLSIVNNSKTYDDWFLPSKDELNEIYLYLYGWGVGGFSPAYYWSSSEENANHACYQYFLTGWQSIFTKYSELQVRAVRAF